MPKGIDPATRSSSKEFQLLLDDLYFRLEERDRWADQTIRFLLYGNGGGIALLLALFGSAAKAGVPMPLWMLLPLVCFLPGVIAIGFLVRHSANSVRAGRRALRQRMGAFLNGKPYDEIFREMGDPDNFPSKWKIFDNMSKWSFGFFICGVIISALASIYSSMHVAPLAIAAQAPPVAASGTDKPSPNLQGGGATMLQPSGPRPFAGAEAHRSQHGRGKNN